MTTRILPRDEYSRLADTNAADIWQTLPVHAIVLVVERDGQIEGHWIWLTVAHVECLWKRAGAAAGVSRRLLVGMRKIAQEHGAKSVWTSAVSDDVRELLAHAKASLVPGDHYLFPLVR